MKKLLQLVGFVLFLVLNFSCSKDDAETNLASGGENGGQVSRYQIVTLNFQPGQLTSDTYMGTWNNTPITLAKADNQLFFYVSGETPLGSNQLVIPTLNNTKINYQVVEATLTQTPTETLQPLLDFQQAYGATLTVAPEDAIFLENHNLLTNFLSGLSDEDKIKAAKFYKANKAIFDPVYNTNYNLIQGRAGNQTQADFDFQRYRALINRHKFAVAVTVVAGVLAATPPYDLVETGITVGVALAGIYKSREIHGEIIDDVFRVVEIKLNNDLGINNRSASSGNTIHAPLTLTDNQLITVPFSINAKNFSNADSNVQKEFVQIYFTAKNKLNSFIGKANEAITWLKNNSFFLRNLRTINTTDVPNTAPLSNFDTNTQIMQGFSFSINHPNLSLETARLSSTGQLDLKIKLVGNPSTTISSTLNYSYNDDFSSFSGSFPIEVNTSSSNLLNFSFYDQYEISTCLGPTSFYCIWKHQVTFSGGTPIGGTIYHRTLWDSQNDGVFEGSTGYTSANVTNTNTSLNAAIYTVNILDNGYCWGNPNTQLRLEYYYVSPTGVESQHYFSPVPR